MKDGLMLLIVGLFCAGGAALFYRFFGNEAFSVIMLVTLVSVLADNARLRRRLREMGAKPEGKRTWL
ncbi:hypothetical protein [Duganella violaceipulchra]|uniref:Uncharacterized protein n=1 Tax=Duganella violaceipulchra TaxID=2849652 RepID=A0AA41HBE0_9BURK|nr:hypothetical protein [Duganella violaceicalia]MCP2011241.1 hypothetical protein [Duganella violaceicalia]